MKRIRLTKHAREQCVERGATEAEVRHAIEHGAREAAKHGREMCGFNFAFGRAFEARSL